MRLLQLEVECFGALVERRFELDGAAFVVEGPNEAGKSSFHAAVETVFYGFQPATREAHPYATWGDDRRTLRLVALVEAADGSRWRVERRLASSAGLRLAREGESFEGSFLGNLALPELQGTPRALFRAVYSLTANEFRAPTDEGLEQLIDELLSGDNGLEGLRSVRALRAELTEERARLWRRDNRGDPEDRRLQRELAEVRRAAREAEVAERQLALDERELEDTRRRIELDRAALAALEQEVEDSEILAEMTRLERIRAELEQIDHSGFGAQPDGSRVDFEDPAGLTRELRAARAALEGPSARLAEGRVSATECARELSGRSAAIDQLRFDEADDRHDEESYREICAAEVSERARALDLIRGFAPRLAMQIANGSPEVSPLRALPIAALRANARAWRALCDEQRTALAAAQRRLVPGLLVVFGGLCAAGAAALAAAPAAVGIGGAALAAVTLIALVLLAANDGRRARDATRAPAAIAQFVAEIGLDPACLVGPDAVLEALSAVDEAEEALGRAEASAVRAQHMFHVRAARYARWRALALDAQLARPDEAEELLPSGALPALLREALEAARHAVEAADRDARERSIAKAQRNAAREQYEELRGRLRALQAALQRALPSVTDPVLAFEELQRLQRERIIWDGEWRQLARRPRFAALADVRSNARARRDPGGADTAELRQKWEALRDSLDVAQRAEGQLAERLRTGQRASPSELAERQIQLEDELRAARRAHDRLALLERALLVGERRFRAANQPDVLRLASEYLVAITAGRYGAVDYPDPEARRLVIRSNTRGTRVAVGPPLSRGVREQVHLCLRLGALEHLDRGREPLPLVLDEALVHWDPARRAALYPTLRALTGRRQVILMTCQPDHAREAVAGVGARRIALHAPEDPAVPDAVLGASDESI